MNKVKNGDDWTFLYSGDINRLLHKMSTLHVKDLLIEEPSLEEVFIHYYE